MALTSLEFMTDPYEKTTDSIPLRRWTNQINSSACRPVA
jgi:hypothetical protein